MISKPVTNLPQLTTEQMIEVDRLMIEEYHIGLIQMMENAGRSLASLAKHLLGGDLNNKRILVLSGKGNNGGGGMVAARHLHNWGAQVQVFLAGTVDELKPIPAQQWQILQALGLTQKADQPTTADLIIDAMIGYGLKGTPRPPISDWIEKANASERSILALDAPSGLNTTTGAPSSACIHAAATLALALPKAGLVQPAARACVGELYLADISVPPELYGAPSLGLDVQSPFAEDTLIRLEY